MPAKQIIEASLAGGGSYRYYNNCVNWDRRDVNATGGLVDMIDARQSISRRTFLLKIDRAELAEIETGLGYGSWLKMANDYHVQYYKSVLHGQAVVFFVHSAIEYVFVPPGFKADEESEELDPDQTSLPLA